MNPQGVQQQYVSNFNIGGINLYINPLLHGYNDVALQSDGELIRSVNMQSYPLGAKQKRPGYTAFLGTTQNQGSQVNTLFSWGQDSGPGTFLYCFAGSVLSYYDIVAGTATDWLPCSNGTFTGSHIGYATLNNTLIIGDGVGSTRHSTDGTTFTNTTGAPAGEFFAQFQNRIYIGGTGINMTYSTANDPTNWAFSGTSDSASLIIPDTGKIGKLFTLANNLLISKSSGKLFRWDGFNMWDLTTNVGPASPYSYQSIEGVGLWLNQRGIMTSQGDTPQLISNPIQRQIYNDGNTGISGTTLQSAPAGLYRYDYFVSVGSVQDDFTNEPLNNAIVKYNYQQNEFLNYQFNDNPTAWATYKDNTNTDRLIFGNASGQVFTYGGTAVSDNGVTIPAVFDMVFNFNAPHFDKDWRWLWGFFNPGCEAQVSIALSNTFDRQKNWIDLGDAVSGVVKYKFPAGARSKLLWMRIRDNSKTARFTFYGCTLSAVMVDPG